MNGAQLFAVSTDFGEYQTRKPPQLYASVFHPDARYYTLLLVDPDSPDPENESFTTYLHWLQCVLPSFTIYLSCLMSHRPNLLLSASTTELPTVPHTRYIPPHPQRGTPYHRYCLFLLPHADPSAKINVPIVPIAERRGFDLRAFCETHGLDGSKGGGAHMWREVWDPTVSDIYRYTLSMCFLFYFPLLVHLPHFSSSILYLIPFSISTRSSPEPSAESPLSQNSQSHVTAVPQSRIGTKK